MKNIPAFPTGYQLPENQSMTLRDYFAAKAMQQVMQTWKDDREQHCGATFDEDCMCMADDCYLMADAMLEARDK